MNYNDEIINIEKNFNNNYSIKKNGELTYYTNENYVGKDTMIIETSNLLNPKISLIFCSIYHNKVKDSIITKKTTNNIALYPNPTKPKSTITLNYSNFDEQQLNIKLITSNGALVKTWVKSTTNIQKNITLDIPNIVNGIYFFNIYDTNNAFISSEQIIIIKP